METEALAVPLDSKSGPASCALPSINVMQPLGTVLLLAVTVAENVTSCPKEEGFGEALTVVVVGMPASVNVICACEAEPVAVK